MKFKDRIIRFMYGRYGTDSLHSFLTAVFFIMWAINLFINNIILYLVMCGVLIYQLMRVFSRNHAARQKENAAYLKLKNGVTGFFKRTWMRLKDIKNCRYRTCPRCRATLRLPRKRGKHTARCPRCKNEFGVHIFF